MRKMARMSYLVKSSFSILTERMVLNIMVTAELEASRRRLPYPMATTLHKVPTISEANPKIQILERYGLVVLPSLWYFSKAYFIKTSDKALKKQPKNVNIIDMSV